jgi:hypothetical protein
MNFHALCSILLQHTNSPRVGLDSHFSGGSVSFRDYTPLVKFNMYAPGPDTWSIFIFESECELIWNCESETVKPTEHLINNLRIKKVGEKLDLFQKQIEQYQVSLRRTQCHLAEYNRKHTFYSNIWWIANWKLVQISVIRCKSIIMQMNTRAQRMFMSLQRIFILVN